ncbi:MAG: LysM peptidoglycan-binding domain-containing protein [Chloroflexi bacterium]|nr:LysM peptidoglycan-binding domain-containing protein [Chloroflexota bacterium]
MRRFDLLLILVAIMVWLMPILPAQADSLPEQAYVSGVIGYPQSYSLSCESRSAADWAAFWGVDISEEEFLSRLPRSDNPNKGFVGNPNDEWGYTPPNSYGVHADPVANLLRQYGLDAHAGSGLSWDELRAEIAAGRPVIVWVVGSLWAGNPKQYTAKSGETVTVAGNEHTMILIGYDATYVQMIDAFTGQTATYSIGNFIESWSSLGRMAIVGSGLKDKDSNVSLNQPEAQKLYTVKLGDTLAKLADEWQIPWQEIAAANRISYPYTLYPGQQLNRNATAAKDEPTVNDGDEIYIVQSGEYLRQIANDLSIDWEQLAAYNKLQAPYLLYPGDSLRLPSEGEPNESTAFEDIPESYVASSYESLFALAHRFKLSWVQLAALNNLAYPYMLSPGQSILLHK